MYPPVVLLASAAPLMRYTYRKPTNELQRMEHVCQRTHHHAEPRLLHTYPTCCSICSWFMRLRRVNWNPNLAVCVAVLLCPGEGASWCALCRVLVCPWHKGDTIHISILLCFGQGAVVGPLCPRCPQSQQVHAAVHTIYVYVVLVNSFMSTGLCTSFLLLLHWIWHSLLINTFIVCLSWCGVLAAQGTVLKSL